MIWPRIPARDRVGPDYETRSLLTTKFHIPATRAHLVPRPRLQQRLAEALTRERSLIVISAPAGFGKTTLLSEWLEQLSLPSAWLSLDPADNDVTRFLAYVSAALQKIHPEAAQASNRSARRVVARGGVIAHGTG